MTWRDVKGYEGIYQVSLCGKVRSLDRIDSAGQRRTGRMLRIQEGQWGHGQVGLWKNSSVRRIGVYRLIYEAFVGPIPDGMEIDHRDGNPKNNALENLRICTHQQNNHNRRSRGGTSKYKGVYWYAMRQRWRVRIKAPAGRIFYIGDFDDEVEAAKAYDREAIKHFGEFARLNFEHI